MSFISPNQDGSSFAVSSNSKQFSKAVIFPALSAFVTVDGKDYAAVSWKKITDNSYSASVAGSELKIDFKSDSNSWMKLSFTNKSGKSLKFGGFSFFQKDASKDSFLGSPAGDFRIFKEAWTMASPCASIGYGEKDFEFNPEYKIFASSVPDTYRDDVENIFCAEQLAVLRNMKSGDAVIAGFISSADQMSDLRIEMENDKIKLITMNSRCDGILVENGATVVSEELVIIEGKDGNELLNQFASLWAERMKARTWTHTPAGWCSWYHYFSKVTENDIIENVKFAQEHKSEYPIEYIQLDDGYQHALGDWLKCNEKFPSGLEYLAQEIKKAGCKAGIWLAPFIVEERSDFYKEHSDWMVKDAKGETVWLGEWRGSRIAVPDASRKEVQNWLRSIFSTLVKYGYDYVKLDFMVYECAVTAKGGIYHDPKYTRAMALRSGVQAIRDAMGDLFMLGCTTPLGPVVGIVNAERISTDITPYWQGEGKIYKEAPTVPNVCRNIINRSYMHKKLWLSDPDVLIVRDTNTKLTENEVIVWTSALWLAGGLCLSGDRLVELKPERAKLAKMLMQSVDSFKNLRPLDLFEREYPALWAAVKEDSSEVVVGVFNFTDKTETYEFKPADAGVSSSKESKAVEFWTKSELGKAGELMKVEVPAHSCQLIFFK